MIMLLLHKFDRQSTATYILTSVLLILAMGILDYLSGPEISFSIFYLVPVSISAWFVNRRAGTIISIASAGAWLLVDLTEHAAYSHPAIPYWNVLVRLGFFLTVTLTLSSWQTSQRRQESLMHFIVHDLRSPLSTMMMGLDILQSDSASYLDEIQQTVISDSLTSGRRMLTLINTLLDLSRLESGQLPLQLTNVNVAALSQSVMAEVAIFAQRRQVTLASQLDSEELMVGADAELMRRVLVNLLSNAIKFSPANSTVTLRVRPEGKERLIFSVIDRGPGIPAHWRAKIFDKFVQVEAREAGSTLAGSGIGLNFCRLAVQAQGGEIWVEGNEGRGRGSTFSFTLPAAAEEARP